MIIGSIAFFVLGSILGSFVGAFVWRYKNHRNWLTGRSICESCDHKLGVLDLIPLFSWLFLRGRCRYCKHSIGLETFLIELINAGILTISYIFWFYEVFSIAFARPINITSLASMALIILWVIIVEIMLILAVYDYKYKLLPNKLVLVLGVAGVLFSLIQSLILMNIGFVNYISSLASATVPIAGLYSILWTVSKGRLVGLGDAKLGLALSTILASFQCSLVILVLANMISTLVILPRLIVRKLTLKSQVAFGPYLILATLITVIFNQQIVYIINTYLWSF